MSVCIVYCSNFEYELFEQRVRNRAVEPKWNAEQNLGLPCLDMTSITAFESRTVGCSTFSARNVML